MRRAVIFYQPISLSRPSLTTVVNFPLGKQSGAALPAGGSRGHGRDCGLLRYEARGRAAEELMDPLGAVDNGALLLLGFVQEQGLFTSVVQELPTFLRHAPFNGELELLLEKVVSRVHGNVCERVRRILRRDNEYNGLAL